MPELKRAIICTPTYDKKTHVLYTSALISSVKIAPRLGWDIHATFEAGDALIQRCRSSLIQHTLELSVNGEPIPFDYMVFIDSDIIWNPPDLFRLLNHGKDVIGGTYRLKKPEEEFIVNGLYNEKKEYTIGWGEDGVAEVAGLPTGFLAISHRAMQALFDASPKYTTKEGEEQALMCNVEVIEDLYDGRRRLRGEDIDMCDKLRELGFPVFLDVAINLGHVGEQIFTGNLVKWLEGNIVKD